MKKGLIAVGISWLVIAIVGTGGYIYSNGDIFLLADYLLGLSAICALGAFTYVIYNEGENI